MGAKSWKITAPFFESPDAFSDYVDNVAGASSYAQAILVGLQAKPVYQGTVDPQVKARRRARNKARRLSQQIQRKREAKR